MNARERLEVEDIIVSSRAAYLAFAAGIIGAALGDALGHQILRALSESLASNPYARAATTVAGAAAAGLFAYTQSKPFLRETLKGESINIEYMGHMLQPSKKFPR